MDFELRCDTASLEPAGSGAIWGGVWVEIADVPFPERNWNDLPVAFVAELIEAAGYVRAKPGRRRRVSFFDGPFWLDLTALEDGSISVTANAHGAGSTAVLGADEFVPSLAPACDALLQACRERGWDDHPDVQRLRGLRLV